MKSIDINMNETEVNVESHSLRSAIWTRETFGDLKINMKSYSIESVFRALTRVNKIKELYGIGN